MILNLWDRSWLWDGNKVKNILGACWRGRRKERLVGNITFNINSYSYWCLSWSLSGHLNPRYNYQPTPLSKTTFILAEIIYGPTLNLTQALEISKLQSFLFKKAGFYSGQNTF